MSQRVTIKALELRIGTLSNPSKMPGLAWSIPPTECPLGSILRKIEGTTCSKCYAFKGRYVFQTCKNAQWKRLAAYRENPRQWVTDIAELIARKYRKKVGAERVFRWFDAGDLQNVDMLQNIFRVCELNPSIKFWLSTRELKTVRAAGTPPDNLVIRVSAQNIGAKPPRVPLHKGIRTSTVSFSGTIRRQRAERLRYAPVIDCPAKTQDNTCADCRLCWESSIQNVNYPLH